MSGKIYLISRGCYSDYSVLSACSTREIAEKSLHLYKSRWDKPRIEERCLDFFPDIPEGLCYWRVTMKKNGDQEEDPEQIDPPDIDKEADEEESELNKFYQYGGDGLIYVVARDADHAIKIANDIRIQSIAEETWPSGCE